MRPPLLTTLVLILFDEGGVGSMKAKRIKENRMRLLADLKTSKRCGNELFL